MNSMDESSENPHWIDSAVERFERPLVLYAARMVGSFDQARDIVQETFTRLCRQNPEDVRGHLAEWLFKVCRNQALDVKRKESRMSSMTQTTRSNPQSEPWRIVEERDSAQHALKLLDTLPDNQAEVIRLKFQAGLSYKQISEVTSLSVTNVGFLIHTALKTIRERMNTTLNSER
jgi:RNA polymerase sigma factor (sigma-70 family)